MTDDTWREFFDSYAPQYRAGVSGADGEREPALLLEAPDPASGAQALDMRRPT